MRPIFRLVQLVSFRASAKLKDITALIFKFKHKQKKLMAN